MFYITQYAIAFKSPTRRALTMESPRSIPSNNRTVYLSQSPSAVYEYRKVVQEDEELQNDAERHGVPIFEELLEEIIAADVLVHLDSNSNSQPSMAFQSQGNSPSSSSSEYAASSSKSLFGDDGPFGEIRFSKELSPEDILAQEISVANGECPKWIPDESEDANEGTAEEPPKVEEKDAHREEYTKIQNRSSERQSDLEPGKPTYFDLKPANWQGIKSEEASGSQILGPKVVVEPAFGGFFSTPDSPGPDLDPRYEVIDFDLLIQAAKERYDNRILVDRVFQSAMSIQAPTTEVDRSPPTSSGSGVHSGSDFQTSASTSGNNETDSSQEIDVVTFSDDELHVKYATLTPIFRKKRKAGFKSLQERKRQKQNDQQVAVDELEEQLLKVNQCSVPHCSILNEPLSRDIAINLVNPGPDRQYIEPPLSFTCLASLCLQSSEDGHMPVNEMYSYIERSFPFYVQTAKKWRNSLRHNLCQTNNYFKTNIRRTECKGHHWTVLRNRIPYLKNEFQRVQIQKIEQLFHTLGSLEVLNDLNRLGLISQAALDELKIKIEQ